MPAFLLITHNSPTTPPPYHSDLSDYSDYSDYSDHSDYSDYSDPSDHSDQVSPPLQPCSASS